MRTLRGSSEDEMVFEFLAAELDSRLFGPRVQECLRRVGAKSSLLRVANLDNPTSNYLRRQVLSCYRGYGRNDLLFVGFPTDAKWVLTEVTMEELGGFYYAASPGVPNWSVISRGSRLVRDGARFVNEVSTSEDVGPSIKAIEKRLEAGLPHAPLLAVAEAPNGAACAPRGSQACDGIRPIAKPGRHRPGDRRLRRFVLLGLPAEIDPASSVRRARFSILIPLDVVSRRVTGSARSASRPSRRRRP
jgi:hypothetical protein